MKAMVAVCDRCNRPLTINDDRQHGYCFGTKMFGSKSIAFVPMKGIGQEEWELCMSCLAYMVRQALAEYDERNTPRCCKSEVGAA